MGAAVSRYVGAEPHEVRGFAHEPRFAEIQVGAGLNTQGGSGVSMDVTEQVPDARLVRRACAGDGPAFGALVDRDMRAAYAVALSVTKGHADAEDAAQEGFMVALERIEECRNADRFVGWLMTIVRNRARNLVRREAVRGTDAVPDGAAAKGPNPEQMAERMELEDGLSRALGGLSEVQREILLLHDLEGWKHREIAERLGIPSGTVRSHLHFASKALQEDSSLSEHRADKMERA